MLPGQVSEDQDYCHPLRHGNHPPRWKCQLPENHNPRNKLQHNISRCCSKYMPGKRAPAGKEFKVLPSGFRNIIGSPKMFRRLLITLQLVAFTLPLAADIAPKLEPIDPNKLSEAQRKRASALFKELQANPDDHVQRTRIIKAIAGIGRASAKKMFDILDRQLKPLWTNYSQSFTAAAKKAAAAKFTSAARQEILKLERQVRSLRDQGDRLSKDKIRQTGDPALERLAQLKFLTQGEIFSAGPGLRKQRTKIVEVGKQRTLCIEQLLLLESEAVPFGISEISTFEEGIARSALGIPGEYLATMRYNTKIGLTIPSAETKAIRDMNRYRMLIGLPPCAIDPRLCKAARDHSKDMVQKDFFAHTSPVPGKKSPWIRAKLQGTTAHAENIYSGNKNGKAANRSWWYSPGHHRNMLNPGSRRVGMGVHGKKWTQMFGN